jgi:hypothetical protein
MYDIDVIVLDVVSIGSEFGGLGKYWRRILDGTAIPVFKFCSVCSKHD